MKVQNSILFSIAMFFVLTAASFAQQVKTDYDHNANFGQYKTFSWEKVQTKDPLMVDRIKDAVNATLAAKGWTQVDSGGDVCVGVGEDLEDSETQQQQLKPTKSVLSSSICSMPRVRTYSGEARRATHFPTMQIRTRRISTRECRRCSHISLRKRKSNVERSSYDDRYKITPPVGPLQ
jgi:hypothetical protein